MTVTLHDVAARSGVSIATVSRAINGLPVSAASRAKVDQAVAALGYVPNEAARTLRNDRSMTVGMVFLNLRNPLALDLIDTITEELEAAGYALLIASARGEPERYEALMRQFIERRVDGLFCVGPRGASTTLARYGRTGPPMIALFDRAGDFEGLPLLTPSFQDVARTVRDHLVALGHRGVALITPDQISHPLNAIGAVLRKDGFRVAEVAVSAAGGLREAVNTILEPDLGVTAVVAAHPHAHGLLEACEMMGVETPGRLSVLGVSEIAMAARDQRAGLSALTIRPDRLGRASAAAMLDWMNGQAAEPLTRVSAGVFDARRTTGPAPGADR